MRINQNGQNGADGAKPIINVDAIINLVAPLGLDAITLIDAARERIIINMRDEVRARANELMKSVPADPYYMLSNSPKANIVCIGINAGQVPAFHQLSADGPSTSPIVVKDVMTAMSFMSLALVPDNAMIVRGNEGKVSIITHDALRAAKALASMPEALLDSEAQTRHARAARLVRTFEALGGVVRTIEANEAPK